MIPPKRRFPLQIRQKLANPLCSLPRRLEEEEREMNIRAMQLLLRYYAFVGSDTHMAYENFTDDEIAMIEYLRKETEAYFLEQGFDVGFGDFHTIDLCLDIKPSVLSKDG